IRVLKGKAGQRVKHFKVFWPEVNNQNWKLHKVGSTYSVSFPTIQGDKRVPLEVGSSYYAERLERILAEQDCERGTLKLMQIRGVWYAVLSITWDVPEVRSTERLGVDRGQNRLAVAATRWGRAVFFGGGEVAHRRRRFQRLRTQLQQAGKYRALKKLERKEARWMRAVNHTMTLRVVRSTISRRIARFANAVNADVWMEDLSGIRQSKQHRKTRSVDAPRLAEQNAGKSRHTWSYYDLEWKVAYKLEMAGRTLHKRPAAYTSKTDHRTGLICSAGPEAIGKRSGHLFTGHDGYCCDADWNAAILLRKTRSVMNIAQWDGFSCPLSLKEALPVIGRVGSGDGVFGNPLNSMNPPQLQAVGS
ncbi:MAG: transposase, partial [Cyanobacteriota bacterium]